MCSQPGLSVCDGLHRLAGVNVMVVMVITGLVMVLLISIGHGTSCN